MQELGTPVELLAAADPGRSGVRLHLLRAQGLQAGALGKQLEKEKREMNDQEIHAMLPLTMEEAYAIELGHERALHQDRMSWACDLVQGREEDEPSKQ